MQMKLHEMETPEARANRNNALKAPASAARSQQETVESLLEALALEAPQRPIKRRRKYLFSAP